MPLRRLPLSDHPLQSNMPRVRDLSMAVRLSPFSTQEHPMSNHTVSTKGGAMAAEGHTTRRAALRALAGASAVAIPTISAIADALSDPIFIAIERHRGAYKAREATSYAMDDVINTREASQAENEAKPALEQAELQKATA